MLEMNLETDDEPGREEEELHYSEFGEYVTRTKGLDLVATSDWSTENHKVGNDEANKNFEHKSLTLVDSESQQKELPDPSLPNIPTSLEIEAHVQPVPDSESPEQPHQSPIIDEMLQQHNTPVSEFVNEQNAPQSSTVDELKALVILTRVELPSRFEDPSDLADDRIVSLKILVAAVFEEKKPKCIALSH
nr:ABC transporter F family member 4-like isoform X1 [Ipomoea batatas]